MIKEIEKLRNEYDNQEEYVMEAEELIEKLDAITGLKTMYTVDRVDYKLKDRGPKHTVYWFLWRL